MKKQIYFFWMLLAVLFTSCGRKTVNIVKEEFEDGSPKVVRQYEIRGKDSILLRETIFYQNGQKYIEGKYTNNQRQYMDCLASRWKNLESRRVQGRLGRWT